MSQYRTILPVLLSVCLFVQQVTAQYKFDKPIVLNRENGLPTNNVRCITKGEDGFVWIGTTEGLVRFDGLEFRTYKPEANNPRSILSAEVNAILPEKNRIWVGTGLGVAVLDLNTDTFRNYQFTGKQYTGRPLNQVGLDAYVIGKDKSGDIWIGNRDLGLCRYVPAADSFVFYRYQPQTEKYGKVPDGYNRILSIEFSRTNDSIIWAGTLSGLLQVNKYTGNVIIHYYPQPNKDYETGLNAFRRIYQHDDGLIYAGSWRTGINVFDPATGTFTPLPLQQNNGADMLLSGVSAIRRKDAYTMWITTALGLVEYNTLLKQVTLQRRNQPLNGLYYGVNLVDEKNRIWTFNINGVHIYDPLLQQFRYASFAHLFRQDRWGFCFYIKYDTASNNIIVCPRYTDALYVYNRNTQQWKKLPFHPERFTKAGYFNVFGFARQDEDRFTVSAEEGLFTFSMSTGKLSLFPYQPKLVYRRYGDLLWDKDNRLWMCADIDGLIRWDAKTGKAKTFKNELQLGNPSASSQGLTGLFMDSRRNIWINRPGGYTVYDYKNDSFTTYSYFRQPEKSFQLGFSFVEDKQGRVWISGRSGWLGYALADEPSKGMQKKIPITDVGKKRVEEDFHTLAVDSKGNIWGCSNTFLVKVNAQDFSGETFSYRYGIDDNDFFGFTILPDDELVMGGRNHIVLANPYDLKRNSEAPIPYLTGINIRQQPYNGSIPVFGKEPLKLGYFQNFFSFNFSAQAFSLGKEGHFRYRLKGFDDWVETHEGRLANYTNVPAGKYTFELQASNNEGVWSGHILQVPVVISTAWWRTLWFRVTAVLLLIITSWWLYRLNIRQVRQKEYMRSEFEKKLANVEMSALRAQMNPHFLFNSLNSIDSYIIRNETKKASEYLNNFARLIRLILQNSRSNYISLKDELETLDLYLQMESLRFKNKFRYEIEVQEGLDITAVDIPPMLIQPYVENAIWHGLMHQQDGSGKVKISIREQEGKLLCAVEDNGIGRAKAMEIRSKRSGAPRRSMGMTITQDRIEIINKLYDTETSVQVTDLTDEKGKAAGTKVELKIPV